MSLGSRTTKGGAKVGSKDGKLPDKGKATEKPPVKEKTKPQATTEQLRMANMMDRKNDDASDVRRKNSPKMRLSSILFRRNLLPNGHIHRGKDRLVKPVEPKNLRALKQNFDIEEQNMLYLRHPYLTEEQSRGHALAMDKHQKRRDAFQDKTRRIFKDDVTLFERLLHLRSNEDWDVYKK